MRSIPVWQLTKEGYVVARYNSICEAARAVKSYPSHIVKVLKGVRRSAAGYKWERVTDDDT